MDARGGPPFARTQDFLTDPEAPLDAASDEVLLARIARRDRAAFGALFRRYAGRVKGFLIRGGFSQSEADEATQEVMLAVWRHAARFDPVKAGAATWLFAIARNRRIDSLRRARPGPDLSDPSLAPEPAPGAEAKVSAEARDAAVRAALADLPLLQLEVVRLAFYDGLSQTEIAAHLGAPLGTVKSRIRLAVARLREALGPDFAQELFDD